MNDDHFPDTIYLDTNSLYSLSTAKTSVTDFLELKKFCDDCKITIAITAVVFLEWHKMLKEKLFEHKNRMTESLNWLNQQLDLDLICPMLPDKLDKVMLEKAKKILEEMGITVIRNTDRYSLEDMIGFAVNKVKPFEQNDKGLRDSVILLTIIDHMTSNGYKRGILITNDVVFYKSGIEEHPNNNKVRVDFYKTYKDTLEDLRKVLKVKVDVYVKKHSQKIMRFLIDNSEFINKFIVQNTKVSEDFLKGVAFLQKEDEKLFGDILKINSIKPIKISSVYPSLLRRRDTDAQKDYEYITFTVETEFRLIYKPYLPWVKPTFSLSNPNEFENIKTTYSSSYGNPTEAIVNRDISVEAKLKLKGDGFGKIVILRVLSF